MKSNGEIEIRWKKIHTRLLWNRHQEARARYIFRWNQERLKTQADRLNRHHRDTKVGT